MLDSTHCTCFCHIKSYFSQSTTVLQWKTYSYNSYLGIHKYSTVKPSQLFKQPFSDNLKWFFLYREQLSTLYFLIKHWTITMQPFDNQVIMDKSQLTQRYCNCKKLWNMRSTVMNYDHILCEQRSGHSLA